MVVKQDTWPFFPTWWRPTDPEVSMHTRKDTAVCLIQALPTKRLDKPAPRKSLSVCYPLSIAWFFASDSQAAIKRVLVSSVSFDSTDLIWLKSKCLAKSQLQKLSSGFIPPTWAGVWLHASLCWMPSHPRSLSTSLNLSTVLFAQIQSLSNDLELPLQLEYPTLISHYFN